MDPNSDDGLADDLVLDIPTSHKTLSQARPSAHDEPGSRCDAGEDGASWCGRPGAYDSDSADDDHSHDLTYLAGRASVMDNMLLSLDQLEPSPNHSRNASIQHPDTPDFTLNTAAPRRPPRNPTRCRNHGHSSSYSSGYSLPYHEGAAGKRMHGRARGESGSSSATIQGGFSRGEKVSLGYGMNSASTDGQRRRYNVDASGSALHSQHSRGTRTKGSKSSNSSSFDMGSRGAVLAPPPSLGNLNHPARRTASMDQLPRLEDAGCVSGASSIIQKAKPIHSSNYDFLDAAPTPTVLQGPRKMASSTTFGQPSPVLGQAPLSPLLGSNRPTTSNRIRKARTEIPDPSVFRSQANEFVDSTTSKDFFLPGHNYEELPAPSPNLSSSQKGWQSIAGATPATGRERPGFFRRVFGSSKSNTSAGSVPVAARQYQSSHGDSIGADVFSQYQQSQQHKPSLGQHHIASQMINHMTPAGQRPSIKDFSIVDQEQTPFPPPATPSTPLLTKKHSSFFRRRKKSVSDAIRGSPAAASATPQSQPLGNVDINIGRHHPSVSSLRQVMNPYLGDAETSDVYFETSENQMRYPLIDRYREDNSHGTMPMPLHLGSGGTTIRAVNSGEERERADWSLTHLGNEMAENIQAAGKFNIDSPKFKLKMRGRSNSSAGFGGNGTNNTFYVENSSAEASDQNILAYFDNRSNLVPPDSMEKFRPMTSPTAPRPSQPRSVPVKNTRRKAAYEKQHVVPETLANSPSSPQQEFHNATSWVTGSETSLTEPVEATNQFRPVPTSSSSATAATGASVIAIPKTSRVWLHPDSSDEHIETPNRAPPLPPLPPPMASDPNTPNFSSTKSTPLSTQDAFQSATSLPVVQPSAGEVDDEINTSNEEKVRSRSNEGIIDTVEETSSKAAVELDVEKDTDSISEPDLNARVSHPAQEPDALALAAVADAAALTDSELPTTGMPTSPTTEDRAVAKQIFDGTDNFANSPDRAVGILGDADAASARVRLAYMELFDWGGINILTALRALCAKLLLKGESQQMDRVLDAFSERWCACNINHGFKARDVVHTISYSILLLNTDLHLANIEHKMTRAQFVKNTLPTILRVVTDAVPGCWDQTIRPALPQKKNSIPWTPVAEKENNSPTSLPGGVGEGIITDERKTSLEIASRGRNRLSVRSPLFRQDSDTQISTGTNNAGVGADAAIGLSDNCNVLVRFPYEGPLQGWETHLEIILKAFYDSIRRHPLPLYGNSRSNGVTNTNLSTNEPASSSLSVMTSSMLRRTPSVMSKAPSENLSINYRSGAGGSSIGGGSRGGTFSDFRSVGFRWTSKSRSRPRVYHSSTMGSSTSRTSLDDPSPWSPAGSSTWSRFSHSRTQPTTAASVDSFRSQFTQPDYQQSIGFANALSQAIIREEGIASAAAMAAATNGTSNIRSGTETGVSVAESSPEDLISRSAPLLDDETLELAGAPWAKEGILKHKHHLEALDKRAKDRTWSECFAVVEKGYMKLFSFNGNGKSSLSSTTMRLRTGRMPRGKRAASVSNAANSSGAATGSTGGTTVVGGGNWSSNAVSLGSFLLRQTIASVLPPPGYSKTRPHVWALSLPTGAVHLFQAGTPDIVREFVSTANYWSARLSKEPLVGGVSNIEYGWSESVLSASTGGDAKQPSDGPPALISSSYGGRLRSSSGAGSGACGSKISLSLPGRTTSSSAAGASRPMSPSSISTLSAAYQQQHRPSLHGSIRSSTDQHSGAGGNVSGSSSTKMRLPGDRITVSEWTPPTQSMMASALLEVDQLRALTDYVKNIEDELSRHNELRAALVAAYTPRQPNHTRATNNWERKSAYLLREIVKFRTYIDSLTAAQALREKVYTERDNEKGMSEGVEASELVARVAGSGMGIDSNDRGRGDNVRSRSGGSAREGAGGNGGTDGRGSGGSARSRGRKMRRDSSVAAIGASTANSNSKSKDESTGKENDITAATATDTDMSNENNTLPRDQLARTGRTRAVSNVSADATSISRSRSREFWKVSGRSGGNGSGNVDVAKIEAL